MDHGSRHPRMVALDMTYEETSWRRIRRRLVTIPGYFLATVFVTITVPIWVPLAAILSLFPGLRGCLRCGLFLTGYLWCECIGIGISFFVWIRHGLYRGAPSRAKTFLQANFRLQCWWAGSLERLGSRIFGVDFEVSGGEALNGPAVIVIPRHASIGDTILPVRLYGQPRDRHLRYVLKRELLFDPCLDIVGNRLPNFFVDRFSDDPSRERDGVASLLTGLSRSEGVVIYPEGTRFSAAKREKVLKKLSGDDRIRAQRWTHLLPPRYGGILALLQANPQLDLLFCAHVGLEGSADFFSLINGSWVNSKIRVHFWRVPFADVPVDLDDQRNFIVESWDRMQREVSLLHSARAG